MLPILIDLQIVKIYTFGVFLVLAFFWSSFLLWRNIQLTSRKEEQMFDGLFISLASGLFIGRLIYVILNFNDFGFSILKFILINGYPGMSLIGCIIGGFLGLFLFLASKKIKWTEIIDCIISPLFLALGLGKLGSFISGVEIGTKTNFLLSIKYLGFDGSRHLTALYESLLFLLAFYISYRMMFEIRRGKYKYGFAFIFFCWYFGLVYFMFDKLKENHLYFVNSSFNRSFSLIVFVIASIYYIVYFKDAIFKKVSLLGSLFKSNVKKTFKSLCGKTKKETRERDA